MTQYTFSAEQQQEREVMSNEATKTTDIVD